MTPEEQQQVANNDFEGLLLVLGIVAFVCALIAARIAVGKNRSTGAFFLVGFFFGPLGVLAAFIASPGEPPPPAGMRAVMCPRCSTRQNVAVASPGFTCWQCKLETTLAPMPAKPTVRSRDDWRGWLRGE